MNKVSHSYTAQYAITLSGELVPHVFLCLQEPTGKFRPRVQKTVDDLMKQFSNVIVTCSKSGKLTTQLYTSFLSHVMLPYVGTEKFLLIIDSSGGQTNPVLYDEIFSDNVGLPSCTVKVIPPKCTAICQPCDVYFYRQVKNFIKRMHTCPYLIENKREINSCEDAIKIHGIIHNQLSAPVFKDMLRYAWYASKLSDDRDIFLNVNDICFPTHILNKPCGCGKVSFIRCSRCRCTLCFPCLYDKYHPTVCNSQAAFDD
ncbi:uncharacterized protein LOC108626532 isoform X1 [Ceratina calcarata]|uniref:Uncharacterized protein LOC108626532 isoform X1 n=1 Tax=Ceratina calcarata TaxID=156304 RepID=A0AAJ7N8E5_9HYME|nr:uncharacterized protein LOC108626532 isoform X1 [Ceratina calcarata]